MFSKLIKKVFKETTNIADITPATFNATGIYNPRYGKQKIYVTGQGGTGTYTPGNPYDNSYTNSGTYTPGNPFDNSYTNSGTYTPGNPFNNSYTNSGTYTPGSPYDNSYTNAGNYTPGNPYDNSYTNSPVVVAPLLGVKVGTNYYVYGTYWVNYTTLSPTSSGQYYNGRQDIASGSNLYNNYAATPYSSPVTPSTYIVMGFVPPSYTVFPFTPTYADVYGNVPGSTTPGNYVAGNTGVYAGTYTPGNYVAGNSGVYAGTYTSGNYVAGNTGVYAGTYTPGNYVAGNSGTYSATVNAGSSTNVFGVTLPGGYGGSASIVPLTIAIPVTTYGTSPGSTYSTSPISITVPSGGYVTITFTL